MDACLMIPKIRQVNGMPYGINNIFLLLEQLHQPVDNFAKYIKVVLLHNLAQKTPTLVGVKLCIYAQLLQ